MIDVDDPQRDRSERAQMSEAEFDALAARSGAALRSPAASDQLARIAQRARRRQAAKVAVGGTAVAVAAFVVGVVLVAGDGDPTVVTPGEVPATVEVTTSPTESTLPTDGTTPTSAPTRTSSPSGSSPEATAAESVASTGVAGATGAQFLPDGRVLVSTTSGLIVWDPISGRRGNTFGGPIEGGYDQPAQLSADGSKALFAGVVWDLGSGEGVEVGTSLNTTPGAVRFTHDGASVVALTDDERGWQLSDTSSGSVVESGDFGTPNGERVWEVSLSPDGSRVVASGAVHPRVYDVASGALILELASGAQGGATFSPDSTRLLTFGARAGFGAEVGVRNAATGALDFGFETDFGPTVIFSPDGELLAAAQGPRPFAMLDPSSGEVIWTGEAVYADFGAAPIAFSADSSRFASALGTDIAVRDARIGRKLTTLIGHTQPVVSLAFSADGDRLVSSDSAGGIKVWDVATLPAPADGPLQPSDGDIAQAATLSAEEVGGDYRSTSARSDLALKRFAGYGSDHASCQPFLDTVFESANNPRTVTARGFDTPGASMHQYVAVFAEQADAEAMMTAIADPAFPACLQAIVGAAYPLWGVPGFEPVAPPEPVQPRPLTEVGDHMVVRALQAAFTYNGELVETDRLYIFVRVGRVVTWLDPNLATTADHTAGYPIDQLEQTLATLVARLELAQAT